MGVNETLLDFVFPISKATLNQFLTNISYGVVFSDEHGKTLYANNKMEQILGYQAVEINGKTLETFFIPKDRHKLNSVLQTTLNTRGHRSEKHLEAVAVNRAGVEIPVAISFNLIREGGRQLIFCLVQDISQQVTLQKELYQQAITDSLTGLYNRRYFDQRLFEEFTRANRYSRPFSVVIIDIDGFKQANDLHGHSFGDEMLIKATDTFKTVLREGDSIYRYGGDEFAMLLPETSKEGGIEVAERLKSMFATRFSSNEKRVRLSLSIGVSSYPEDGMDDKNLISAADRRMYSAKDSGGNMVSAYDEVTYLNDDTSLLLRSLCSLAALMERSRGLTSRGLSHSQSTRTLSIEIAHRLGLSDERIALLEQAAILHDIGNITVPAAVLCKKNALSDEERLEIRKHTMIGEEIIDMLDTTHEQKELQALKRIIGEHHERIDGSGYPRGLKNSAISIEARILAAADAYNAMVSERPYRKPMTQTQALQEMQKLAGTLYDTEVVSHLLQIRSNQ